MQFSSQLINQWINLIQDHFITFFFSNISLFILFSLVYLGVLLDPRFQVKYRIFLLLLFYYLFIFYLSFFDYYRGLNSDLFTLIGHIFWYSLVIQTSFIWHMCILDWLYQLFRYMKWDYLSFLITRISFFTSLGFFYYLCLVIFIWIRDGEYFHNLFRSMWKDENSYYFFKDLLFIPLSLLQWSLIGFISWFCYYCSFFMVKNNSYHFSWKSFFIFFGTLFISYYILGIPRLYLLWIYIISSNLYELISELYDSAKGKYMKKSKSQVLKLMCTLFSEQVDMKCNLIYRHTIVDNYLSLNSFNYPYGIYFKYKFYSSRGFFIPNPLIYYRKEYLFLRSIRDDIINAYNWGTYINQEKLASYISSASWQLRMSLNDLEKERLQKKLSIIYRNTISRSVELQKQREEEEKNKEKIDLSWLDDESDESDVSDENHESDVSNEKWWKWLKWWK